MRLKLTMMALCLSACGADGGTGAVVSASCGDSADDRQPFVTPDRIHTGENGRDLYRAVLVANVGTFSLRTRDPDVLGSASRGCLDSGDSDIVAVLTGLSPGETRLTFESGAEFRKGIDVVVAGYTTAEYDLGDERYNNPANANLTDRVACNECHKPGAGGALHSPLQLAGNSDDELVSAVTTSAYPGRCEDEDGKLCACTPSGTSCGSCPGTDCAFNAGSVLSLEPFGGGPGDHEFNLTTDERVAITAYMRAITPDGL